VKQKEKDIISHLRKGVVNISQIARELKVPVSTVADRIKRIEQKYVLKRSSLLDYNKIGYNAQALLAIKVNSQNKKEFLEFLKRQDCLNSLYHTNSDFDFLVEVVFRENIDLFNWIEVAKNNFSVDIKEYHILKIEDKERFVPI
jgi:DNA-binding Lrp family transcriptional regulator